MAKQAQTKPVADSDSPRMESRAARKGRGLWALTLQDPKHSGAASALGPRESQGPGLSGFSWKKWTPWASTTRVEKLGAFREGRKVSKDQRKERKIFSFTFFLFSLCFLSSISRSSFLPT